MANMKQPKTELWRYCSVCRRNHDDGKKHKYSKQHKNKLGQIMSKFSKKVRSARRTLTKPSVIEGELEPGAKMWCYCCELEIEKHVTDGNVSIEWGALIEHLSNSSHHKKTRYFWWVNGAEQNQLQTFLLFPIEYRHYKELVDKALKKLEEKREDKLKEVAEQLRMKEQMQSMLTFEVCLKVLSCIKYHTSVPLDNRMEGPGHSWNQVGTSQSTSKTSDLSLTHNSGTRGNVHTGATPPWLREDDSDNDDSSSNARGHVTSIGPSVEEFIKHKERVKHSGKNPRRVGADFHLKLALQGHQHDSDDDDWLPSFGRVWNYGPRVHSKNEFLGELEVKNKKRTGLPHTSVSSTTISAGDIPIVIAKQTSSPPSTVTNIKPYARKRTLKSHKLKGAEDSVPLQSDVPQPTLPKVKPYVRRRTIGACTYEKSEINTVSSDSLEIPRPVEGSEVMLTSSRDEITERDRLCVSAHEIVGLQDDQSSTINSSVRPYKRKRTLLSKKV